MYIHIYIIITYKIQNYMYNAVRIILEKRAQKKLFLVGLNWKMVGWILVTSSKNPKIV